jgi:drug/metabolite transporter (DMT)-like permease
MWFLFAMVTALAWGGADLFYKRGSRPDDRFSHLKIAVAVGVVMGIHAIIYLFANKVDFRFFDMVRYLPVSALYILSMVVGYIGLRYLLLSVSSPVQNASGALVTVFILISSYVFKFFPPYELGALEIAGICVITAGVVGIAVFEKSRAELKLGENKKYSLSFFAILFPILYCVLDALGTFADAIYLDELELISEDAALIAYEFTFLLVAVVCGIVLAVKKAPFKIKKDGNVWIAAVLETAGQFFYVFAMADKAIITAPLVATYSVFSVIFSSIFLKEKLKIAQYAAVAVALVGISLLGISEGEFTAFHIGYFSVLFVLFALSCALGIVRSKRAARLAPAPEADISQAPEVLPGENSDSDEAE